MAGRGAAEGADRDTGSPRIATVPASGAYRPAATFISDDLPAPFSPNRAWTSPVRTANAAPSRAMAPSNDFRMPVSSSAALMGRSRSFLGNHTRNVPIHLPQTAVIDRLARGDPLRAGGVLERTAVNVLALDDRIAFGHHLIDRFLGDHRVAAGDIGSAILDAGEGAVRARLPVSSRDLLERRREVLVPGP